MPARAPLTPRAVAERKSKRLVWLSDTHLNFVTWAHAERFVRGIAEQSPDLVVLSGDVADALALEPAFRLLEELLSCPVYYVLGNHDYYHGSIAAVRAGLVRRVESARIRYLPKAGVVQVCPGVALLGHDGWADGRNGDYRHTTVELNDFRLIAELKPLRSRWERYAAMAALADEAAAHFAALLPGAAAEHRRIVAVTHVPPFAAAAFHEGQPSAPDWQPFFSSRTAGEAMLEAMARQPACQLTVLCGHTHGEGVYQAAPNVEVRVAAAEYGRPRIADILTLG